MSVLGRRKGDDNAAQLEADEREAAAYVAD